MSSSTLQYHFVSTTASNFNFCVVLQLAIAVLSSLYDTDVSAAIAVMGLIAVLDCNVGLLFLYLFFAPATCVVDIVRMVSVSHHYATAGEVFFILLRLLSMLLKGIATYFGYLVYQQASTGDSGYEQINGPNQPGGSSQPAQQSNPFVPASYVAPPTSGQTGPVVAAGQSNIS